LPHVKAIANDSGEAFAEIEAIDLHDVPCIADFVLQNAEEFRP
jgi:hypothetical protein